MLLEALAACAGITLKAVATALEFRLGTAAAQAAPRPPRFGRPEPY
jgi:hypothetical protein